MKLRNVIGVAVILVSVSVPIKAAQTGCGAFDFTCITHIKSKIHLPGCATIDLSCALKGRPFNPYTQTDNPQPDTNNTPSARKQVAINTPTATSKNTGESNAFSSLEQAVYAQVNQYRATRGLPPLTLDARISNQARIHSQDMASYAVPFGHQGFEQRVQAISKVISYNAAAENVAYNQGYADPATQAVQGWLQSTGHRQNIESQYGLTGIGVVNNAKGEYYFTQIFIRSR
jgi:uncharacterized protein YkwD